MSQSPDYVAKNASYAATFKPEDMPPLVPGKTNLIVTCMDPRLDPYAQFGAKLGDTALIRNGGGSTYVQTRFSFNFYDFDSKEALRSIVIAQQMGTRNIAVIHHTDCGMTHLTTQGIRSAVKKAHPGDEGAAKAIDVIDFLEFTDIDGSVKVDVEFLHNHPLILKETNVTGWTFDLETGKVHRVV